MSVTSLKIWGDAVITNAKLSHYATRLAAVVTGLAVYAGHQPAALAQQSNQQSRSTIEEITVSARRVEESLQDAAVTVTALDGNFLNEQGINSVNDVVLFSPGANFTAFNKMQAEFSLRGVSSQSEGASGDSSIVTVIDNVVVSKEFMKNPTFFDMERVEILRGPQGTTFGRNASSGLIHLISKRPTFDNSIGVLADVGNRDILNLEGFVNGAISENLAGRFAARLQSHGGFTDDWVQGGRDLGAEEAVAFRGSLLWNPTDTVQVYLKAEYNEDDDENPAIRKGRDCSIVYQGDFPDPSIVGAPQPPWSQFPNWTDSCDPWESTISDDDTSLGEFFLEREITNITAEVAWDLSDSVTLTSVTGYIDGNSDYLIDTHGGPNNSMFQSVQNDANQFSQEFRLDNHASGAPLRWLAGLYYLTDEQTRDDQNIFYVDDAVNDPQAASGFRPETRDVKETANETESIGIFGDIAYDFSDRWTGSFGFRYSEDDKDYQVAHYGWGWGGPIAALSDIDENGDRINGCVFAPGGPPDFGDRFCGSPTNPVGFTTPVPASNSWDNTSFKASLDYRLTDDKLIYGLISQGYKTGGFQSEPANPLDAVVPFDEETVTNYELGFKGDFGDRFRLNATVFMADYEDLQLFLFQNSPTGDFTQVTRNAANADISGLEGEFIWQPTDNLRLSGSFAFIESELVDALLDTDEDPSTPPTDFSGTRPDNTPEWSGTFVASYDIPLASGALISLRGDWRGLSDVFDDIGEDPNRRHDSYGVFGARATYFSASGNWSVALWGRNLTEEDFTVNVGPYQPNLNQLNFSYGAPLTYGATFNYTMSAN